MPAAKLAVLLLLLHSTMTARRVVVFPTREIGDFRSYRDGTFLHFRFPEGVRSASWNFTAWENKIYGISACEPRPVNVFLKHSGYPVVSLDNSTFPADYFLRNDTVYTRHFLTDRNPSLVNLSAPLPGDWFAVVFNDYVDPDNMAIQQSGLVRVCVALLESSIEISLEEDTRVLVGVPLAGTLNASSPVHTFNYFVPSNTSTVVIGVTGLQGSPAPATPRGTPLLHLTTSVLISGEERLEANCAVGETCEVSFAPPAAAAQRVYLAVTLNGSAAEAADYTVWASSTPLDEAPAWSRVPLTRRTYTGFFTYGFEQTPFENGTEVLGLDVGVRAPTLLNFHVNPIQDIGGTISIEISIDMKSIKEFEGQFQVLLLACVAHGMQLVPKFPGACLGSTGIEFPNQLQANSTSEATKTNVKRLHIPYPESGEWFLSLQGFCFTEDAAAGVAETECGRLDTVNATLIVESLPCGADKCGRYGRCSTQMDGGLLFSTCYCLYGYRGWGCTDDAKVGPQYELLIGTLLLTLSNLFFFPAIVVSIRRRFYTEALVYAFTMFFSTFYHACDSGEGTYTFCIFNLSILQFCDFYSAVMSLWVTIIAMANVPPHLCSMAHMAGAVFIALGTEYNRTSLFLFLVPAVVGVAIMTASWVSQCRRSRACYPRKAYWKYYLPPGLLCLLIGLMCFSFLQTQRNYKYVHSAWHSLMALAILFVLPRPPQRTAPAARPDDLEEIRSESQSPSDSTGRTVRGVLNGWLARKK